jgi:NitT/TauT family transport system substrate-binding protein
MITRRQFMYAAGIAGASAMVRTRPTTAQAAKVRLGNAAGITDAQLAFITVGQHQKLGYFRQEGVEVEIINMASSSQTLQALATGSVEVTNLGPPIYAQGFAKSPDLNVISTYVWMHQIHWSVAVKPDSPVQDLRALRGKKIGIRNPGDSGFIGAKAMFKEVGLDPDQDFEWISVGSGAPAGQGLDRGQVDALAIWDGEYARIENLGFKLRYLANTPGMKELFGGAYGANRSALKANHDRLARMFRGMAKSTIFAATNPETAIRLHWELYPETKPKGKSDAEALREALHVIKTRTWKWLPAEWQDDKRMGGSTLKQWQALVRFAGVADKIPDASVLFTNALLDEVNQFDRKAIETQARSMTL